MHQAFQKQRPAASGWMMCVFVTKQATLLPLTCDSDWWV